MKRRVVSAAATLALIISVHGSAADMVKLKNGHVIDGTITAETADYVEVKLPMAGENFMKIRRKDIQNVVREGAPAQSEAAVPAPADPAHNFQNLIGPDRIEAFKQGLVSNGKYEELAPLVNDDDYTKRNPALTGLAVCGDFRGIELLEQLLSETGSATPPKASAAVLLDAIEKAGSPSSVAAVAKIAVSGKSASDRRAAVWSLGKMGFVEAVPVVEQAAQDADSGVRAGAAFAAGKLSSPASRAVLISLLKDPEMDPKLEAAKALESDPFPEAVPALIGALNDRYAAAPACLALGKLKAQDAVPKMLELLTSTDPEFKHVRQQAARGLGMIGDPAAIDPLVALLGDTSGLGHMCAHALSLMIEDGPDSQKPADWIEWAKNR
ncbi:MAG: HEAT repeat domain-containing protein [Kiritimatiellia bacterium]